jgi:hypothetical protein
MILGSAVMILAAFAVFVLLMSMLAFAGPD